MKKKLGYFLAELLIVTLGVSISLFMNDYRENQKELQREQQLLEVIIKNLEQDSLNTLGNTRVVNLFITSSKKMKQATPGVSLDTFNIWLDHVTSYGKLETTDVGFRELSSSGLRLGNDSLYRDLLRYYTAVDPLASEWNKILSELTLQSIIPFVIDNFPKLVDTGKPYGAFTVSKVPEAEVLSNRRFQNLLMTNVIYNKSMLAIAESRQSYIAKITRDCRTELKKLKN